MLRIGVAGAAGRMGRALIQAILEGADTRMRLSAAIHRRNSPLIGVDAGEFCGAGKMGLPIVATLQDADFDLLIDFTLVEPSLQHLEYCQTHGKMMVIGTTGFDSQQIQQIELAGKRIPIVLSPNMSVGVNLCLHLLKQAAVVFGDDADIEIVETHHRHKIDAPSGTAIRMGEIIADSLGRDLSECAVYARQGLGKPRDCHTIGFSSIRAGDVVGDHTVLFASEGERLEITHKASSRRTFANGALRAAIWLADQDNGLYDMQDVLEI